MSIICAFCGTSQNSGLAHTTGIAYGKQTERERIIKLLEEAAKANPKDYSDEDIWAFEKAIALIKGENE